MCVFFRPCVKAERSPFRRFEARFAHAVGDDPGARRHALDPAKAGKRFEIDILRIRKTVCDAACAPAESRKADGAFIARIEDAAPHAALVVLAEVDLLNLGGDGKAVGITDKRVDERTFASLEKPMSYGGRVDKGAHLFNRLDIEKELKELEKIAEDLAGEKDKKPAAGAEKTAEKPEEKAEIGIEDFDKVQLKVGVILDCKKVEKADKLLCSTVDLGEEKPRTIVSGIAKYYAPEDMPGRRVVVVSNLKPVKLRGILSQGMLLCASDQEGRLTLLKPDGDMPAGSDIS